MLEYTTEEIYGVNDEEYIELLEFAARGIADSLKVVAIQKQLDLFLLQERINHLTDLFRKTKDIEMSNSIENFLIIVLKKRNKKIIKTEKFIRDLNAQIKFDELSIYTKYKNMKKGNRNDRTYRSF